MGNQDNDRCDDDAAEESGVSTPFDQAHIDVIPLDIDGGDALCEMQPHTPADAVYIRNGQVRLPRGRPVELHFHLQNGADNKFQSLEFESRPWSFEARRCPDRSDNDNGKFPEARRENSKLAIVKAPPASRNWGHFSLNFELGVRWDPIIIRD